MIAGKYMWPCLTLYAKIQYKQTVSLSCKNSSLFNMSPAGMSKMIHAQGLKKPTAIDLILQEFKIHVGSGPAGQLCVHLSLKKVHLYRNHL